VFIPQGLLHRVFATPDLPAHARRPAVTVRDVVFPPGRQELYQRNRYSPAVRSNGFLFVSGQVGSREDGSPEPDFEEQVRLAFRNLNAILAEAGCSFDDVLDVTVYIVDPEKRFETAWKIASEFWGEAPHPTLTGIGVTWLYGFHFEIKVIARIPR
jgi:enamine deaminase RidA (YjgF/YER057c/UK114 family)